MKKEFSFNLKNGNKRNVSREKRKTFSRNLRKAIVSIRREGALQVV